jgi:predicted ATPase
MIESVCIRGFKCLRDVTVGLHPLTVLIGKNDTGKSSFLDAFFRLARLVANDAASAFSGPWAVERLLTRPSEPPADVIRWRVALSPSERVGLPSRASYEIAVRRPAIGVVGVHVEEETLRVEGRSDVGVGFRPAADAPGFSTSLSDEVPYVAEGGKFFKARTAGGEARLAPALTRARAEPAVPTARAVARSLTSTVRYWLQPTKLARAAPFAIDEDQADAIPYLDHDGGGPPLVLDYLLGSDRAAFARIEEELRKAIPFITGVLVKPAKVKDAAGQTRAAKALAFRVGSGGEEIPAPLMSDGALLYLAFLTLLHGPTSPALILLEEPENGVHPAQLRRIAELLRRLADSSEGGLGPRAAQIVVATHSPYLLDFVDPESVLVFGRRASGDTVVKPLLELAGVRERLDSGFSLGELWFNVGEDALLEPFLREQVAE